MIQQVSIVPEIHLCQCEGLLILFLCEVLCALAINCHIAMLLQLTHLQDINHLKYVYWSYSE